MTELLEKKKSERLNTHLPLKCLHNEYYFDEGICKRGVSSHSTKNEVFHYGFLQLI